MVSRHTKQRWKKATIAKKRSDNVAPTTKKKFKATDGPQETGGLVGTDRPSLDPLRSATKPVTASNADDTDSRSDKKVADSSLVLCHAHSAVQGHREELAFQADADDHAETPYRAYADIAAALDWLAQRLRKSRKELKIYDPYYCAGGVKRRLGELGFLRVTNENVDCYSTWRNVECDVLLTNPPYSADHLIKLATFCSERQHPWLWLVPEWTHKRDDIITALGRRRLLYLSPTKRYVYEPPSSYRAKKKSDTHKKTAPFHSIWIVWAGTQATTDALANYWNGTYRHNPVALRVARSRSQLRDLRRRASKRKAAEYLH